MKPKHSLFLALSFSTGCDSLLDIQDKVDGYTDQFVVQAIYLGLEEPTDPDLAAALDAGGGNFDQGSTFTVFLADAGQVSEIENAPITGAVGSLLSPANGSVELTDEGNGKYTAMAEDGLVYTGGETVTLQVTQGGAQHKARVDAPAAPTLALPETHSKGTALAINLEGQGFDSALVVVLDMGSGSVTWSNEPSGIGELYDMTHGDGGGASVAIPASALSAASLYAVGVAGMVHADPDTFDEVNTALSTMMAGKLIFGIVCTLEPVELCEI
jgi:hypothetical protein